MNNKEFAKELEKRTLQFAVRIIRMSAAIPGTIEGKVIKNQITKSGTSVGANYREANRSRSTADFKSKIRICQGEISETMYWLELILATNLLKKEKLSQIQDECNQLLALFTAINKPKSPQTT